MNEEYKRQYDLFTITRQSEIGNHSWNFISLNARHHYSCFPALSLRVIENSSAYNWKI